MIPDSCWFDTSTIVAAVIGAVGSAFGAYWGAKKAFALQTAADKRIEDEERVAAVNRALFILGRQMNLLANAKKQIIDPYRLDPARHFHMKPAIPQPRPDLRIGLSGLDFLLVTELREDLFKMQIADDWFHGTLAAQEEHHRVHRLEFQPKLAKILAAHDSETIAIGELEAALGPKLTFDLKRASDEFIDFTEKGISRHDEIIQRFCDGMKKIFPDKQFIRMTIAEDYFSSSQ